MRSCIRYALQALPITTHSHRLGNTPDLKLIRRMFVPNRLQIEPRRIQSLLDKGERAGMGDVGSVVVVRRWGVGWYEEIRGDAWVKVELVGFGKGGEGG